MHTTARDARIVGVDTARGLAVLGMFVAHLGMERHTDLLSTTGWFFLADGRPSALFAMLAGIGMTFMTRRAVDDPAAFAIQRARIVKRAGILFLFGYVLMFLGTPVAVILPAYAVLFVAAIPFLRMRAGTVLTIAAAIFAVMPQILVFSRHAAYGGAEPALPYALLPGVAEVWGGYYPAITWLGYILVGVAIGRMNLRSIGTPLRLLGVGGAVAALAYGLGHLAEQSVDGRRGALSFDLVTIEPHANTTTEMVGNAAFAAALLGLCLLVTRAKPAQVALTPVSATGAMSLTVYSLHIVYIAVLGVDAVWNPVSNWPLIWLVLVTLIFATLWQLTLGQGPFERLLRRMIRPPRPPRPVQPHLPPQAPPGHGQNPPYHPPPVPPGHALNQPHYPQHPTGPQQIEPPAGWPRQGGASAGPTAPMTQNRMPNPVPPHLRKL